MKLLTAKDMQHPISELSHIYEEIYWAVAWGSHAAHGEALLRQKEKFRQMIFGVSFSQTDPDLVDALVEVPNAYIATDYQSGTFHPKVYCFRSGDEAAAVIGSSNFTRGGFQNNLEANVLIRGAARDKIFRELFTFVDRCVSYGVPVTKEFAATYRASYRRAMRLTKAPKDPLPSHAYQLFSGAGSGFQSMQWGEYVAAVKAAALHDIGESLNLLCIVQTWFASVSTFSALDEARRKAIAGTLGEYQKRDDQQLNRDWGWFGSMRGAGDFANRISENDASIAVALDNIPRQGHVTEGHYNDFLDSFYGAFKNSTRTGGIKTASRLLAMKRPDVFLCVSKRNLVEASQAMGFSPTTLTPENYWNRVVEPIQLSDWYNNPRPRDKNALLWDFRAAMLDAVFYRE